MKQVKNLLVIVDVINGFVSEGALADTKIQNIISPIQDIISQFIRDDQPIVAFRDCHTMDSQEFDSFPPHCVLGSGEEELASGIIEYQDHFIVMDKNSTSGFVLPEFMEYIQTLHDLENIIVVGCCTDICIMNLAIPLKNYYNQINKPMNIITPINATDTYHIPDIHDRDEWNSMAHRFMLQAGIIVPKTLTKEHY